MTEISSATLLAFISLTPDKYKDISLGLLQHILAADSLVADGLNPLRISALPTQYEVSKSPSTAMGSDGLSAVSFPVEESNEIPFLSKKVSNEPFRIRSSGVPHSIGRCFS